MAIATTYQSYICDLKWHPLYYYFSGSEVVSTLWHCACLEYLHQTPHHTVTNNNGPLRATVDGDARRERRYESTATAISVDDLNHSDYLQQYQHSTPMQPGR